ncbi:phage holin family protein [Marinoscillum sp.]|uniref:phage holin family protein n=1 Tax=Marinoscillum sp. TaxID=2024838 RepID=UPI003BA8CD55
MAVFNKLVDKISEYIRLKGEKIKLDIIAQVSRLLAHFVAFLTIGLIGLFLLIFLSLALSAYLNSVLESPHFGYLIVGGVYFIVLIIIILLLRSNRLQSWLETLFVNLSETIEQENVEE